MKREWRQAYTEYFLVANVRGVGRVEAYNGYSYRSRESAQRDADRMNARRNVEKYGAVTVDSKEREAGWVYSTTLRL